MFSVVLYSCLSWVFTILDFPIIFSLYLSSDAAHAYG
jgi:hypothetical protein